MSDAEQARAFAEELDKLVARFADEFDLPYATAIGVLQIKAHGLCVIAYDDGASED